MQNITLNKVERTSDIVRQVGGRYLEWKEPETHTRYTEREHKNSLHDSFQNLKYFQQEKTDIWYRISETKQPTQIAKKWTVYTTECKGESHGSKTANVALLGLQARTIEVLNVLSGVLL